MIAVATGGLKNREGPIDVGPKVSLRLLDRRYDIGSGCKVKDSFRPGARHINGTHISNVGLDDLESRISVELLQIAAPADRKIVEHANATAFSNQPVNEMTSDEARPARHQVKHGIPWSFCVSL